MALGPQAIGELGWVGIGFVITISIILQAFYNVEIGRYVMATGEVPTLGFGRIPPGAYIGTILAVGIFYLAFLTGGWASAAGASAFTLFTGTARPRPTLNTTRWIAVGLMAVVFGVTLFRAEDLADAPSSSSGCSSASSSSPSCSPS